MMYHQPLTVLLLFITKFKTQDWENKRSSSPPKTELGEGGESNYPERLPRNEMGNKWEFFPWGLNEALQRGPTLPPAGGGEYSASPASRGGERNCGNCSGLKAAGAWGRKHTIPPGGGFCPFRTSLRGIKFSFSLFLQVFLETWGSIRRWNRARTEELLFFAVSIVCMFLSW